MNEATKIRVAARALDLHEKAYGAKIPARLRAFFEKGEAFAADGKCLPSSVKMPEGLYEPGAFRLRATVPAWGLQAATWLDDAVVGVDGDWTEARYFVPLFRSEGLVVAAIDDQRCPIGWFTETTWQLDGKQGYRRGVFPLADSLEEFLALLETRERAEWERSAESAEMDWEEAAEPLGVDLE
jgi:hypothetical protein